MSELEALAFGKQGPINVGNDAEIVIYHTTSRGETTEALRIPFMYDEAEMSDTHAESYAFRKRVHTLAEALKETYAYWPDGYVHIQTIINDKDVNALLGVW
jgi:hypothetical protein